MVQLNRLVFHVPCHTDITHRGTQERCCSSGSYSGRQQKRGKRCSFINIMWCKFRVFREVWTQQGHWLIGAKTRSVTLHKFKNYTKSLYEGARRKLPPTPVWDSHFGAFSFFFPCTNAYEKLFLVHLVLEVPTNSQLEWITKVCVWVCVAVEPSFSSLRALPALHLEIRLLCPRALTHNAASRASVRYNIWLSKGTFNVYILRSSHDQNAWQHL